MHKLTEDKTIKDLVMLPDKVFTATSEELYNIYIEYECDDLLSFTLFTEWIESQKKKRGEN